MLIEVEKTASILIFVPLDKMQSSSYVVVHKKIVTVLMSTAEKIHADA